MPSAGAARPSPRRVRTFTALLCGSSQYSNVSTAPDGDGGASAADDWDDGSSATATENVSVALSPSESVAVYVYVVAVLAALGIPDTVRVEAVKIRPGGNAGVSE